MIETRIFSCPFLVNDLCPLTNFDIVSVTIECLDVLPWVSLFMGLKGTEEQEMRTTPGVTGWGLSSVPYFLGSNVTGVDSWRTGPLSLPHLSLGPPRLSLISRMVFFRPYIGIIVLCYM